MRESVFSRCICEVYISQAQQCISHKALRLGGIRAFVVILTYFIHSFEGFSVPFSFSFVVFSFL